MIVGLGQSPLLRRPRFVLSASALCDGNGVSFRWLADHHQVPFVFLDVPPEPTPAAVAYLVEQLHATIGLLGRITGRTLDARRLARAVSRSREAAQVSRRFFGLRAGLGHNLLRGPQMINLMFPFQAMAGSPAQCRVLGALARDAAHPTRWSRYYDSARTDRSAARLLWAHIAPLYNYDPVWSVLDDGKRAKMVGEECSHCDEADLDCPGDIEFVARRLIGVPQNGTLERRLERLERLRRQSGAEAVVHFSQWRCHQAAGAVPRMERFFTSRGVPFLNLNGDCVDATGASLEQHVTRAEAFVESLGHVVHRG